MLMNFYEILGVSENATQEEIKATYRAKALEFHPDRNPNNPKAEETFKKINSAYEVLGNPEKRAAYNQQLHAPPQMSGFSPFMHPADLFANFFGMPMHSARQKVNFPKFKATVNLTLAETLEEQIRNIRITAKKPCEACKSSGTQGKPVRCNKCQGQGCPFCGNSGSCYVACEKCKGNGTEEKLEEVKITIPKGIPSNTQLQTNTPHGAVLTSIHVQYPENIKLGATGKLIMSVFIPYHVAVLGGTHPVNLFDGTKISVKFPPMQDNTQMIKIKNKGIYTGPTSEERSDLFLLPSIEIPKNISDEHKTIIEQLATIYTKEVNSNGTEL